MADVQRLLLETGCKYSNQAYNDKIKNGTKIESKLTSTTAFFVQTKTIAVSYTHLTLPTILLV